VPPTGIAAVTASLAAAVLESLAAGLSPELRPLLEACRRHAPAPAGVPFVDGLARDLVRHRGRVALIAGPRQPAEVHALTQALNLLLDGRDHTVTYTLPEPPEGEDRHAGQAASRGEPAREPHLASARELVSAMRRGEVETLVILGGNPGYDLPADLDLREALRSVKTALRLGPYEDETTAACFEQAGTAWHLPGAHYLESWGDLRAWDGTFSVVQPLIAPLYDGRTPIELLSLLGGEPVPSGYELVRQTASAIRSLSDPEFERSWRKLLEDGILSGSARPTEPAMITPLRLVSALERFAVPQTSPSQKSLDLLFIPDGKVWDGRFANNAWLQETPDPLTKMTWDNAALISPATAALLGVRADDLITLQRDGRELTVAAYLLPGMAPFTVALPLGYGRHAALPVARGAGFNAYRLRTAETLAYGTGLTVTRTGRTYKLACTQNHHVIDAIGMKGMEERIPTLIREGTLEEFKEHPEFARHGTHHPPLVSLWKEHEYEGHRWGMSIDLSACTGCSACVVACTAENNIPVVGKQRVIEGREMHWLRIDRYFTGGAQAPRVAMQPVACVHCEMAPCEQVCPVAATMHDREGLNVMVYNRCIGTRYCSNNCPFKVRRFNFFNYRKGLTATQKMAMNPEVTVRSRGVMEKCTYCLQRIEAVKIRARNEQRPVRDAEITPACAQTCPTGAIVFGDLNDPQSRVSKLQSNVRAYATLEELNIKPRTLYLARLRNPSEEMGTP
jgi:molybdopterin-containing oxidoreductase family iron-sulfur binding subunit